MSRADGAQRLRRLLNPATIAVAGGDVVAETIRQCRALGFAGPIWPVNPRRAQIEGIATFASVAELPAAPDAAFVAVPREQTIEIVAALAARGAGGAVCYASGFAEAGGEGVELQRRLVDAAGDMALLGPNCYGLVNYLDGCALWPDLVGGGRVERGVAILTQSGNIALNLTMQQRCLPIACVVAVGNRAVSDIHDLIDALLVDPRITAIGLHLEALADVPAFSRAALAAQVRGIPVVALKSGSSAIGAQLAASHTRSLAGADVLYEALFRRCGVARVHDLAELLETLKFLHVTGGRAGDRVGSLSCSGGDASMVADIGQACGLRFPALDASILARLSATLGPKVPITNPLDYQTYVWGDVAAMTACFAAMMDADVDVCQIVLDFPRADAAALEGWEQVMQAFIAARRGRQRPALLVSSMPELLPDHAASRLLAEGIAPMQGLREAAVAVAAGAFIAARRQALPPAWPLRPPVPLRSGAPLQLDEISAKAALAAFGVPIPPGAAVAGAQQAMAWADANGYPVVLKAVSCELAHKTELGAVKLGLADAADLGAAADGLRMRFEQLLVEKMVDGGVAELIVGITRDPQFGLALTIGAGGVLVELLADSATLLLPASRAEIESALRGLRCFALLDGYRGRPRANLAATLDAIEAVAAYAQGHADRLVELDVNPLIVSAHGAVAVDALIRMIPVDA